VFHLARLLLPLLLAIALLRAETSLDNARRAQAMLGPDTWSQVITVHNEARGGVYPRIVHALVFELAGILWFYTDLNGTQSFSLHYGQLEREKRDFAPLLREIEPGFVRWTSVPDAGVLLVANDAPLRNGCLIESVVALRERMLRGVRVEEPRLLSYYMLTRTGLSGHTVLAYRRGDVMEIFDPARPEREFVFSIPHAANALTLARALDGRDVEKARYVPLHAGDFGASVIASAAGRDSRATDGG
jgi:hypothetical protein